MKCIVNQTEIYIRAIEHLTKSSMSYTVRYAQIYALQNTLELMKLITHGIMILKNQLHKKFYQNLSKDPKDT
jgi:hypothetical protein